MISCNKGKVKIEGDINFILADFAVIKKALIEILEDNGLDPEEAFESIEKSDRYASLRESGMDIRSTLEIIMPDASEKQIQKMINDEKRFDEENAQA